MQVRPIAVLLLAALCVPRGGRAEAELLLGVEATVQYDDNVLVQSDNALSDYLGSFGPRLELRDEQGKLRYEAHYYPSYEKFVDLSELDGWNHNASGSLTWRPSVRTSLTVRDYYLNTNRAIEAFDVGEPIDPTGEAAALLGRRGFTQNIASGELSHQLTRVDLLTLSAQNVLSENEPFRDLSVTEGDVTGVGLSWLRAFSGRDQAGLVVRYTTQTFENVTARAESRSDFYNGSLQWIHRFDPTFSFSVSAGPAWVTTDVPEQPEVFPDQPLYPVVQTPTARGPVRFDSCPRLADGTVVLTTECEVIPEGLVLPRVLGGDFVFQEDLAQRTDLGVFGEVPETESDGLTYFAAAALTKQWRRVQLVLRYSRDASTTASASGNVRDVVQASLNWQATSRWRLGLVAAWEQREQEEGGVVFDRIALAPATAPIFDASVPGFVRLESIGQSVGLVARRVDRTVTFDRYSLGFNVTYRLSRRTSFFANLSWSNQTVSDPFADEVDASRFKAVLGLRYYLDPIQLPI